MNGRLVAGVVGVLIFLSGSIFALQGANVIGGSSVMNGSVTWIYVGGSLAVVGVLLAIMGFSRRQPGPAPQA